MPALRSGRITSSTFSRQKADGPAGEHASRGSIKLLSHGAGKPKKRHPGSSVQQPTQTRKSRCRGERRAAVPGHAIRVASLENGKMKEHVNRCQRTDVVLRVGDEAIHTTKYSIESDDRRRQSHSCIHSQ